MNHYLGSCFCGKVQYEISDPIKFVVHDHCSICRRISGAAFVTWVGVKSESSQFRLIQGNQYLSTFKSSADGARQFCRQCGSHLFFRSSRWDGEIHVTRATLKSDELARPSAHVFYSDKADWMCMHDELPKLGGEDGVSKI